MYTSFALKSFATWDFLKNNFQKKTVHTSIKSYFDLALGEFMLISITIFSFCERQFMLPEKLFSKI
jgi:hypothetical protein